MRLFYFIIIFNFFVFQSVSHANIFSANYNQQGNVLHILSKFSKTSRVDTVSLANCARTKSFEIDANTSIFTMSKYFETLALTGTNSLKVYNVVTGKLFQEVSEFEKPIKSISQSYDGAYIAATDGQSIELFTFGKNDIKSLSRIELLGGITSVYPDFENKKIYVVEQNNTISTWDFTGKMLKSFKSPIVVNDIMPYDKMNEIILVASNGLYKLDKQSFTITPIVKTKIANVVIDSKTDLAVISNGSNIIVYNMLHRKLVKNIQNTGNPITTTGANFVGIINRNDIKLYDLKVGAHIASINVSDKGVLMLEPDSGIYSKGIAGAMEQLSGMRNFEGNNEQFACAAINAMISGVYMPTTTNVYNTRVNDVKSRDVSGISGVKSPDAPNVPDIENNVQVPDVAQPSFNSGVLMPSNPNFIDTTMSPSGPNVPNVGFDDPSKQMAEGSVPAWFANRKNLPVYNVVSNSNTQTVAVKSAKTQIKNDLIRNALTGYVKKNEIKTFKDTDVMKRFLWQAASRAANSLDKQMTLKEVWISPASQQYVLVGIDDVDSVQRTFDNAFAEELKLFNSTPEPDYMAMKVNVIE